MIEIINAIAYAMLAFGLAGLIGYLLDHYDHRR